jgi:hypothetical protein
MTMNTIACEVDQPQGMYEKLAEHVASRRNLVKETRGRLVLQRNITKWSVKASRRNLVMRDTFRHLVFPCQFFCLACSCLFIGDQFLVRVIMAEGAWVDRCLQMSPKPSRPGSIAPLTLTLDALHPHNGNSGPSRVYSAL